MSKKSVKVCSAAVGTVMVLSAGMSAIAGISPADASAGSADASVIAGQHVDATAQSDETVAAPQRVEGQFSYSQEAITPTATISSMFSKAAAALCVSLPEYGEKSLLTGISVSVNGEVIGLSTGDIEKSEGTSSLLVGCACSSNGPGGGAIMNAEVSGVSVEALASVL